MSSHANNCFGVGLDWNGNFMMISYGYKSNWFYPVLHSSATQKSNLSSKPLKSYVVKFSFCRPVSLPCSDILSGRSELPESYCLWWERLNIIKLSDNPNLLIILRPWHWPTTDTRGTWSGAGVHVSCWQHIPSPRLQSRMEPGDGWQQNLDRSLSVRKFALKCFCKIILQIFSYFSPDPREVSRMTVRRGSFFSVSVQTSVSISGILSPILLSCTMALQGKSSPVKCKFV